MALTFEPLAQQPGRKNFASGQPVLDDWFQHRASQDMRKRVAQVFVATDSEQGIVGFYSLSSFSVALPDLPPETAKKLPRYEAIPVVLIGRLARSEKVKGQGVGELLLADALRRVASISSQIGINAIVVDAIDEHAVHFYQEYGFLRFPSHPMRLFLPMATVRAALEFVRK